MASGDCHHHGVQRLGGVAAAVNPQAGSAHTAAPSAMPGLWRRLQAPKGVGCASCGARARAGGAAVIGSSSRSGSSKGPAACAGCLAVVYCGTWGRTVISGDWVTGD